MTRERWCCVCVGEKGRGCYLCSGKVAYNKRKLEKKKLSIDPRVR